MGVLHLIVMFLLVMSIAVSIHAKGQNKTALWGVLVFFTGIIGLVIYAISLASD